MAAISKNQARKLARKYKHKAMSGTDWRDLYNNEQRRRWAAQRQLSIVEQEFLELARMYRDVCKEINDMRPVEGSLIETRKAGIWLPESR